MQRERAKPWQLKLHAISSGFDLKLSLNLKLSPPSPVPPKKSKSFKSRFVRFFGKFMPRSSKNKPISAKQKPSILHPEANLLANRPKQVRLHRNGGFPFRGPMGVASVVVGLIGVICQSIYQNDAKSLVLLCAVITLLCLALVLRNFSTRWTRDFLDGVIIPVLICSIWVYVAYLFKANDNVSDSVWKILNYAYNHAPSSGRLRHLKYGLSQMEDILTRCVT